MILYGYQWLCSVCLLGRAIGLSLGKDKSKSMKIICNFALLKQCELETSTRSIYKVVVDDIIYRLL